MRRSILLTTLWLWVAPTTALKAKPIIIDTDIFSDVDDVGALAVANVLHNCGLCDMKGVVINTNSRWGALAASAINTYFGNGDVLITAMRPITNATFFDSYAYTLSEYASKIAYHWPRSLNDTADTPDPLNFYTDILRSAEPHSVTIISIGFLTNIAELLSSPGGLDLIAAKIEKLVVMGGRYPSCWEYNFGGRDAVSAGAVIRSWPRSVPITFSGGELGESIFSGQDLSTRAPMSSPIRAAYEWYVGRGSTTRESWDPVTVLYGILGLDGFAKLGVKAPLRYGNVDGFNTIAHANGSNAWVNDSSVTNQHWLELADGVGNSSLSWLLNSFYSHDPIAILCPGQAMTDVFSQEEL